jgi:hypothetical protein
VNLADVFQIDSFRHRLRPGRPISTSIRILYVFILFNICSLDASGVNSGLPVMIAYFLPFLGDVVLRRGPSHEYTLPLPTQRPSVIPPGIQNVYHSNAYTPRQVFQYLGYFREYLLMFFPNIPSYPSGIACSLLSSFRYALFELIFYTLTVARIIVDICLLDRSLSSLSFIPPSCTVFNITASCNSLASGLQARSSLGRCFHD